MATPVFVLVLSKGNTEAWHGLSKEQQDALWAKVEEADKRAGATWHISRNSR